jgi:hypothetical protein
VFDWGRGCGRSKQGSGNEQVPEGVSVDSETLRATGVAASQAARPPAPTATMPGIHHNNPAGETEANPAAMQAAPFDYIGLVAAVHGSDISAPPMRDVLAAAAARRLEGGCAKVPGGVDSAQSASVARVGAARPPEAVERALDPGLRQISKQEDMRSPNPAAGPPASVQQPAAKAAQRRSETPPPAQPANSPDGDPRLRKIAELEDMGFPRPAAEAALALSDDSLEAAVGWLLDQRDAEWLAPAELNEVRSCNFVWLDRRKL